MRESPEQAARRQAMACFARATEEELEHAIAMMAPVPNHEPVRGPESGIVMVRGRIGGGGAPFNLGEATISRATIRLDSGEIGFGQCLGLSRRKAELSALLDALAQTATHRTAIAQLVANLSADHSQSDATHARQTAATKVEFFTMVRGDD
ncbi:phosphonate C-P lyase system protein PhnG [Rhizobium alvei]|uniref:Phosphonate C-P lyase system protein PhnG n=1 Tax=Rhizobium alvei TaxID=1132659 RepID=A0ABT8YQ52_9HYPH|nr:phosphonate C-P lyase system protein PhnG [Rhizobium alvei]MDO6965756.1 phosphonate C-P lyase system protein PhnG [Rhizobium alvei]